MRFFRFVLAMLLLAGCGRRVERAWFDTPPPKQVISPLREALPPSACQVRWSPIEFPREVEAGTWIATNVTFMNAGDKTWADKANADPKSDGSYAVRLAWSWHPSGKIDWSKRENTRSDLAKPLAPGESATHQITIRTPETPGQYQLLYELLQENVVWFADMGGDYAVIPVHVRARGATSPQAQPATPPH